MRLSREMLKNLRIPRATLIRLSISASMLALVSATLNLTASARDGEHFSDWAISQWRLRVYPGVPLITKNIEETAALLKLTEKERQLRCDEVVADVLRQMRAYGEDAIQSASTGRSNADAIYAEIQKAKYSRRGCEEMAKKAYAVGAAFLIHPRNYDPSWMTLQTPDRKMIPDRIWSSYFAAFLLNQRILKLIEAPNERLNGRKRRIRGTFNCADHSIEIDATQLRPFDLGGILIHEFDHLIRDHGYDWRDRKHSLRGSTTRIWDSADWRTYLILDETHAINGQSFAQFLLRTRGGKNQLGSPYRVSGDISWIRQDGPMSTLVKPETVESNNGIDDVSGYLHELKDESGFQKLGLSKSKFQIKALFQIMRMVQSAYFPWDRWRTLPSSSRIESTTKTMDSDLDGEGISFSNSYENSWVYEEQHRAPYGRVGKPPSWAKVYDVGHPVEKLRHELGIYESRISLFFVHLEEIAKWLPGKSQFCQDFHSALQQGKLGSYIGKKVKSPKGSTGTRPGDTGVRPGDTGVRPGDTGVRPTAPKAIRPCLLLDGKI